MPTSKSLLPLIYKSVNENTFVKLTLQNPKRSIRLFKSSKGDKYQLAERRGAQEFHQNFTAKSFIDWLTGNPLTEGTLFTGGEEIQLLKSGKLVKKTTEQVTPAAHDRPKNHLLDKEALPSYFKALDIKKDKQLQIEKFLREVEAVLPAFEGKKTLNVVDFGCGKAYLTFALYDFLSQRFAVKLVGIDIKQAVMENCQLLADELNYKGLSFQTGRIEDIKISEADLAVALHACDTATDAALAKAVSLSAKVILAAPCCQHEFYNQIDSLPLNPLLKHGILRERFASIATDAVRGLLLESVGYEVKIVEFIDAAHTPKNILIRAIFTDKKDAKKVLQTYEAFKAALHIRPALETLLPLL